MNIILCNIIKTSYHIISFILLLFVWRLPQNEWKFSHNPSQVNIIMILQLEYTLTFHSFNAVWKSEYHTIAITVIHAGWKKCFLFSCRYAWKFVGLNVVLKTVEKMPQWNKEYFEYVCLIPCWLVLQSHFFFWVCDGHVMFDTSNFI